MKSKHYKTSRYHLRHNNLSHQNQSSQIYNREAARTDDVGNEKQESNHSRFWRECRERDIRKRKKIYDQFKKQTQDNFASTINQLKNDAQILSTKFEKLNSKKKNLDKISNQYQSTNLRQSNHKQSMHTGNVSMKLGNSSNFDQSVSYNFDVGHNDDKENQMEQSENLRIFFENKKYYSSLHHKYLNSKRSISIQSVYDYFESFNKNDENNLKTKLRQKWQDLKKDVDASFSNYFNKRKGNKAQKDMNRDVLSNTYPFSNLNKTTYSGQSSKPSKSSNLSRPKKFKTQNIYNKIYNDKNIIVDTQKNIMNEQKDAYSQPVTQPQPEIVFQSEIFDDTDKENNVHDDIDDFMSQIKNDQAAINNEVNNQENTMNLDTTRTSIEEYEQEQASSMYSVSHLQKSNEYWDLSVRELKQVLLNMNLSINECIEKKDLIQKLKAIEGNGNDNDIQSSMKYKFPTQKQKQQQHVNLKQDAPQKHPEKKRKNKPAILYDTILYDTRESKQQIMNRVDLWIHRWSYRRSFRQLLNSILGYKSTDQHYITRGKHGDQNSVLMMKLYKKAILLIHPDKHINSPFEIRYKSGEMFKVLNKYKQKYENRKKP